MMPINLRYNFYDDKNWFIYSKSGINSSVYNYAVLSNLENFIEINDNDDNYYNLFYSGITHDPYFFNSDYTAGFEAKEVDKKDINIYKNDISARFFYANVISLRELTYFIKFLKDNEIYDNTKIIFVSDHGVSISTSMIFNNLKGIETISPFNALLMFKDFDARGELKISTNLSTIADMPYLATKHITNIRNYFTGNLISTNNKNMVYSIETHSFLKYTNMICMLLIHSMLLKMIYLI